MDFGPTLESRVNDFIKESEAAGFFIQKYGEIDEKKTNQYGKEYEYPIAIIVEKRMTTNIGNVKAFFYVIVNRKHWFKYCDGENYLDDKKWEKENFVLVNPRIINWMYHFNRKDETVLVVALPNEFKYGRFDGIHDEGKTDEKRKKWSPKACIVPFKETELALIHDSLFIDSDPHDKSGIGKTSLNISD